MRPGKHSGAQGQGLPNVVCLYDLYCSTDTRNSAHIMMSSELFVGVSPRGRGSPGALSLLVVSVPFF